MITEDYVSFEVAKLLKEKGFDKFCHTGWDENLYDKKHARNFSFGFDKKENWISRPTHQMAMKWLREVHNIFIVIDRHYFVVDKISHIADGFKYSIEIKIINTTYTYNDYKSYEEAVEAALKFSLGNPIVI